MRKRVIVLALALTVGAPVAARDNPQPTGMALQQIQARDFETTVDVLFPSVVTVLQDSGYRIDEADRASGFISGIGSAQQKTTFNLWWGFGHSKTVPMVSVFVEQRGPNIARARLNFVLSKAKDRKTYSDETPVTDPAVYRDAFERIEKEIFVRQAMNAPAPVPAVTAPTEPVASTAATAETTPASAPTASSPAPTASPTPAPEPAPAQ